MKKERQDQIVNDIIDYSSKYPVVRYGYDNNNGGLLKIELVFDTAEELPNQSMPVQQQPASKPKPEPIQTQRRRLFGKRSSSPSKPPEPGAY